MKNNKIFNEHLIVDVNTKFKTNVALGGRRALALVGITFNRPITDEDDHDLVVNRFTMYQRNFLASDYLINADGPYQTDTEKIKGCKHYYFYSGPPEDATYGKVISKMSSSIFDIRNCFFINKNLVTDIYKGILIVDPEQILYFKKQYIENSSKHKEDFENMTSLVYNLRML
jgi:hypothetical protein